MSKILSVCCLALVFMLASSPSFSQAGPAAGVVMKVDPNGPHPEIRKALNALGRTEYDLDHAAHDYAGHRAAALEHVRAAEAELQQCLAMRE